MPEETKKITKDMPIGEIISKYPETVEVMMNHGLHCVGCAAAHFENLSQGCEAHGIDADKLVEEMNKAISSKKEEKKE